MVVHDFPPLRSSGVYRPLKFAKYLPDFGWRAHILTIAEPTSGPLDRALLDELPPETQISRARGFGLKEFEQALFARFFRPTAPPFADATNAAAAITAETHHTPPGSSRSFLSILKQTFLSPLSHFTHTHLYVPDIRIGWKRPAIALGRQILASESIDAIYSTSAPETTHLVAQQLHQESGLPWVAEYRDPWYQNFTRDQYPDSRLKRELAMQRAVMQDATAIVYSAPRMRGHNRQVFADLPEEKQFVIPNGYDEANFGDVSIRYTPDPAAPLRIVHVGTVYEHSTFPGFLRGLKSYYQQHTTGPQARLVFVGDPGSCWTASLADPLFTPQIDRLGFLPHQEAVRQMRQADLLLLTIPTDGRRFPTDYNIPGKVFELIRAERPIIMVGNAGDTADIITQCSAGEILPPDQPDLIAAAISRAAREKQTGKLTSRVNLSVLARYDRRTQTGQLADILNAMTSPTTQRNAAPMRAATRS